MKLTGEQLTRDDRTVAGGILGEIEGRALKPLDGEQKKTEEEMRLTKTAIGYIEDELRLLEVEPSIPLVPAQFHILDPETFRRHFPHAPNTFNDPVSRASFIYRADRNLLHLLKATLHEGIHAFSFHSFYCEDYDSALSEDRQNFINVHQVGYGVRTNKGNSKMIFVGLDEAMVDNMVIAIFQKRFTEFISQFNLTAEECANSFDFRTNFYLDWLGVIAAIIKKIAQQTGKSEGRVWYEFQYGLFAADRRHLAQITKVFGPKALRVLSMLGKEPSGSAIPDGYNLNIARYFDTDDPAQRRAIEAHLKL